MARIIPSLAAILLCGTALAGCSTLESINPFGPAEAVADKTALEQQVQGKSAADTVAAAAAVPADLDSGVRMAHELRLAGKYDDASRILSQLMLVASDDPRVVSEYGKTLLQRGRLEDAAQFLNRATQLRAGDWTTWSALGVAYDQMGNQASAKFAYDHALALAPNEASVLSNFALSRLLANDVAAARDLATRAANAGGTVDPRIARNIAMIEATSPQPAPQASAAPESQIVATAAPAAPIRAAALPPAPQPVSTPTAQVVAQTPVKTALAQPATAAPRILVPQAAANTPPGAQQYGAVEMAIPVAPAPIRLKPPTLPQSAAAPQSIAAPQSVAASKPAAKPVEAPKPAAPLKTASVALPVKPEAVTPVAAKTAEQAKPATGSGVPALRLASDAATP